MIDAIAEAVNSRKRRLRRLKDQGRLRIIKG
jgi:hypothetical protein